MKNILAFISITLLFTAACQTAPEADAGELQRTAIIEMENRLKDDVSLDTSLAMEITSAYVAYADEYPEDSLSPYYLVKAADILKEMRMEWLRAVNLYGRVHHEYPEHPITPKSVFMIGFVFDEKFNDRERADKSYTYFLEQYPEHHLANDAENLRKNLRDTVSDLEQIKKWMEEKDTTKK